MEATALCFRLLMLGFILLNSFTQKSDAAFLRITPKKLQLFQFDSVSFDCGRSDGSTKLKGIRNTEEFVLECDIKTPTVSSCTIERVYPADSGEYWCETEGGDRSNTVNISVTAGSVILESPVLPVKEGETVTLCCRNKTSSINLRADFYKDGLLMKSSSGEEMTIKNVSKSDEGLYKCSISGAGVSPESWLAVRGGTNSVTATNSITGTNSVTKQPKNASTIPQSPNNPPRALILLWITVTVLMVALVLLVVGFLHMRRRKASSKTPAAASHLVCGEEPEDDPDRVTYAVVVKKNEQDKDAGDAADNLNVCLESNHSSKPQSEREEDESSLQVVYSAVTIRETPQALQRESSSTAAKTEQQGLYAAVLKATNSRDT